MESVFKNSFKQIVEKYKYLLILIICIGMLFIISSKDIDKINTYVNNQKVVTCGKTKIINGEVYYLKQDIKNIFEDNCYIDDVSDNIVFTSWDCVLVVNKELNDYVELIGNDIYYNASKIGEYLNYDVVINDDVYFIYGKKIVASVNKNRVELYNTIDESIKVYLNNNEKISIFSEFQDEDFYYALVNEEGNVFYGKIAKSNVDVNNIDKVNSNNKFVIVNCNNKLNTSTTDLKKVDALTFNMIRISGQDSIKILDYNLNNVDNVDIYCEITNGQDLANFDPEVFSRMLSSYSNRSKVEQDILTFVLQNNLEGIYVNISNLNTSENDLYMQYINELAAMMHKNCKKIIVSINNTKSMDVEKISKKVDYIVIKGYGQRTISSKIAGPTSSLLYICDLLKSVTKEDIDNNKIILNIDTKSILWTERLGTVIDAEEYSMNLVDQYIRLNKVDIKKDKKLGQNYIEYKKGQTYFKMWIEDAYSIENKIAQMKNYNVNKLMINESGSEKKEIYNYIDKNLK